MLSRIVRESETDNDPNCALMRLIVYTITLGAAIDNARVSHLLPTMYSMLPYRNIRTQVTCWVKVSYIVE